MPQENWSDLFDEMSDELGVIERQTSSDEMSVFTRDDQIQVSLVYEIEREEDEDNQ